MGKTDKDDVAVDELEEAGRAAAGESPDAEAAPPEEALAGEAAAEADPSSEEADGDAAQDAAPAEDADSLRAALEEMNDKFMRALADAENTRKRAAKERMEAEAYGGARLARDLLAVYDGMKRAVDAVTDEHREMAGPLIEGVELTMRELLNVFSRHGIEIIDPQVGDRFDPNLHEAMFEAPVPDTAAGDIIQVSAQGFAMRDRILRPAQVGVSSAKEAAPEG